MRGILLTLLLGAPNWAEAAFGTWKVDPARSVFSGNSSPRSLTVYFESHSKGEVFTPARIGLDPRAASPSTILCLDGASHHFRAFVREPNRPGELTAGRWMSLCRCANGGWTRFVRRYGRTTSRTARSAAWNMKGETYGTQPV